MVQDTEVILEGEQDEETEEIKPQERHIVKEDQAPSIFDLRGRARGREPWLVIQPKFQRRPVWDKSKQSKFIESILLDVPLPLIFLGEEDNGRQVVIDGQQRLRAVFDFYDNKLNLTGLKTMTELDGLCYQDLNPQLQQQIKTKPLPIVLIKKESPPKIMFDVFERLNTGAVPLAPQELRNCYHMGRFNDLIVGLSHHPPFQELLGFQGEHPRMKDVELVLRFFAFLGVSYENYQKSMKSFLDAGMGHRRSVTDQELQQLGRTFKQTVALCKSVFGEKAFRRYDAFEGGGRWRTAPNVALYDVVMYGFARRLHQRPTVMSYADAIREAMIFLLCNDDEFNNSIDAHTSDKDRVTKRFSTWLREIDDILGTPRSQEPRLFSYRFKEELFRSDKTCTICQSRIHDIDDAEVDHIEQYWKGGRTIPENARLTHRFCNRTRRRQENEKTNAAAKD